jgi:hypothetical protein
MSELKLRPLKTDLCDRENRVEITNSMPHTRSLNQPLYYWLRSESKNCFKMGQETAPDPAGSFCPL